MVEMIISIGAIAFGIYFFFLSTNRKKFNQLAQEVGEEHAKKTRKKMRISSYLCLFFGVLLLALNLFT